MIKLSLLAIGVVILLIASPFIYLWYRIHEGRRKAILTLVESAIPGFQLSRAIYSYDKKSAVLVDREKRSLAIVFQGNKQPVIRSFEDVKRIELYLDDAVISNVCESDGEKTIGEYIGGRLAAIKVVLISIRVSEIILPVRIEVVGGAMPPTGEELARKVRSAVNDVIYLNEIKVSG